VKICSNLAVRLISSLKADESEEPEPPKYSKKKAKKAPSKKNGKKR